MRESITLNQQLIKDIPDMEIECDYRERRAKILVLAEKEMIPPQICYNASQAKQPRKQSPDPNQ